MSQAQALYNLQQIELQIVNYQKRQREIKAILENDKEIIKAQAQVDQAQETLTPLRAQMRDMDLQIQSNISKREAASERLYSGNVKNPKELQDLQNEIESLKKWQTELEDRMLEIMVAVEEAEEALATAETQLQTTRDTRAKENQALTTEQAEIEQAIQQLNADRETTLAKITPENVKLYNDLKPRKANRPVSLMREESCTICGIQQTPIVAKEVRQGDKLVMCKNCGRILLFTLS